MLQVGPVSSVIWTMRVVRSKSDEGSLTYSKRMTDAWTAAFGEAMANHKGNQSRSMTVECFKILDGL